MKLAALELRLVLKISVWLCSERQLPLTTASWRCRAALSQRWGSRSHGGLTPPKIGSERRTEKQLLFSTPGEPKAARESAHTRSKVVLWVPKAAKMTPNDRPNGGPGASKINLFAKTAESELEQLFTIYSSHLAFSKSSLLPPRGCYKWRQKACRRFCAPLALKKAARWPKKILVGLPSGKKCKNGLQKCSSSAAMT